MTTSRPGRIMALLATPPLLALSIAATSTAVASSVPDDSVPGSSSPGSEPSDEVVVHDEGAADPRINLRDVPVAVGSVLHSRKTTESSGEIRLSGQQTMDAVVSGTTTVEQTAEVIEVAPDGGFTVIRTVDAYDFVVTAGPSELGGFLQSDEELEPLVGIPLRQRYGADHILLSVETTDPAVTLTPDQEAAVAEILADGADEAPLPDSALGVGASWTTYLQGSKGATAEFELVSLDGATAGVDLVVDGDAASMIDPESPLQDVAGTVTGSGSMTIDLTNSLDTDSVLDLTVDMTGTTQGITFAMTLDSTMSNDVTPG